MMQLWKSVMVAALVVSPACKEKGKSAKQAPAPSDAAASNKTPPTKTVATPDPAAAHQADASGITWFENDYPSALASAKSSGKPILIDMWADWCHTCLAMKKGTLADAGLAGISEQFVWLAIDTEDPSSAAVMAKFPPKVWPTFFVVSPGLETVQASLRGSAPVRVFREFLERGALAHRQTMAGTLEQGSALDLMRQGDTAWMEDKFDAAAEHYANARAKGGESWPLLASALKNEIAARSKHDKASCARLAASELVRMGAEHSSAGVDFLYYGSDCAGALPMEEATTLRKGIAAAVRGILANDKAALSTDDRSDAMGMLRRVLETLKDADAAKALAVEQKALLQAAVAKAKTPLEEMTYVWHQVEVHAYLGEGEAILPWVLELEKKLPNEYDPPYRLAWLYLAMDRHAEAHEAIARALPKTSGARLGSMMGVQAAIYKAEGNTVKEREVRAAVVRHYEGLEKGRSTEAKLAAAKAALAKMDERAP